MSTYFKNNTSITRPIKYLVVHCSDSVFGDTDFIRRIHKTERGFTDIGYHFVILNGVRNYDGVYKQEDDGVIEYGRDISIPGAHAMGHNYDSIGVCLIGKPIHKSDVPMLIFTPSQISALIRLGSDFLETFNLSRDSIIGHNDLTNKKICPGFDVKSYREKWW